MGSGPPGPDAAAFDGLDALEEHTRLLTYERACDDVAQRLDSVGAVLDSITLLVADSVAGTRDVQPPDPGPDDRAEFALHVHGCTGALAALAGSFPDSLDRFLD